MLGVHTAGLEDQPQRGHVGELAILDGGDARVQPRKAEHLLHNGPEVQVVLRRIEEFQLHGFVECNGELAGAKEHRSCDAAHEPVPVTLPDEDRDQLADGATGGSVQGHRPHSICLAVGFLREVFLDFGGSSQAVLSDT